MTRYRCNHCRTVFEAGTVRDCCLPAAVAEQRRLRGALTEARRHAERGETDEVMEMIRKSFGGRR